MTEEALNYELDKARSKAILEFLNKSKQSLKDSSCKDDDIIKIEKTLTRMAKNMSNETPYKDNNEAEFIMKTWA